MRIPSFVLCTVCTLLLAACSSSDPASAQSDAPLSLLPPGLTIGTTLYGSADLDALGDAEQALLAEAAANGLRGFTYYVDWADLEPEPGRYTFDDFEATLAGLQALGLVPFVNITVGDIEDYNLPAPYSDGEAGIAPGVALDDQAVLDRFGVLLDRVVPVLLSYGGFALGVGNEIDARLDGEFVRERDAYVRFVEAARERVRALDERLAVAVTLTGSAVRQRSATFRALQQVTDVILVNYGPIRPDFLVRDVEDIRQDFREVISAYGTGPVLIQELTCPSAPSMGASAEWQHACFDALFDEIKATPEVRFASVFTFQDFDAATCDAVREALFGDELNGLPTEMAQRLTDYLCMLGVVAPDGSPKPAWAAIAEAASESVP